MADAVTPRMITSLAISEYAAPKKPCNVSSVLLQQMPNSSILWAAGAVYIEAASYLL